ncbi:MAG: hypothetical protein K0Q58_196 [Microbacterium sp.]|nr:hypothetical protein [Microbacterium sp.]
MTQSCGSAFSEFCQPAMISASVMTPMVFCASFVPCASATSEDEKICPHRKPSRPSGCPSWRRVTAYASFVTA